MPEAEKSFYQLKRQFSNKLEYNWNEHWPVKPNELGVKQIDIPIEDVVPYIDWTPFFSSWQLKGKYPAIFEDQVIGEEAQKLYNDAQIMLSQIADEKWLSIKAVIGLFEANSDGEDVVISSEDKELGRIYNLREQKKKAPGRPNISLTDFIAPNGTNQDYIGAFCCDFWARY